MTKVFSIPLTRGYETIVDEKDFEWASKKKWHAVKCGPNIYAHRWEGKVSTYLHRAILKPKSRGERVDHVSQDGLDNRRSNLRISTASSNGCNRRKQRNNTSGYVGVSWYARQGKWMASIGIAGKCVCIGYFKSAESAARARDARAKESHGQFARLNFPS